MNKLFIHISLSLICISLGLSPALAASDFPDIPNTDSAYFAIQFLQENDIVKGYSDGSFKPNKLINRAEVLKIILKSSDRPAISQPVNQPFPDVPRNSWYAVYVAQAKDLGIISGNLDGTFTPDRAVNKAELLKMLLLTHEINTDLYHPGADLSIDVDNAQWFSNYFNYALQNFVTETDESHRLYPYKQLSRAEVSQIIYNFILVKETGILQSLLFRTEDNLKTTLSLLNSNNPDIAIARSETALGLCQKALIRQPENPIAISACNLSEAYINISKAQSYYDQGKLTSARVHANDAVELSEKASQLNENIQIAKDELIQIARDITR